MIPKEGNHFNAEVGMRTVEKYGRDIRISDSKYTIPTCILFPHSPFRLPPSYLRSRTGSAR